MKTLERPEHTAEIIRRLRTLGPDCTPRWGRMSAHQAVCHLSDSFRMAMAERPVSPATGPLQRSIVKWSALYLPLPFPKGVMTRPEIDQECTGTGPVAFAADIRELEALVARFTSRDRTFAWPTHPIFGRMSRRDWRRWAYLHADHHLRQFGV